jgi:hypothetical protein
MLMEVDNEIGCLMYALGKCVFVIMGQSAYDLITGNFKPGTFDAKRAVKFFKTFPSNIRQFKITKQSIIVNFG